MPETVRALVVDPSSPQRLGLKHVDLAPAAPDEVTVRVTAISLNRGEVRRSTMAPAGWRPGWDLAGTVERAASDGTGPKVGARVVGAIHEPGLQEVLGLQLRFAIGEPRLDAMGIEEDPVGGYAALLERLLHAREERGKDLAPVLARMHQALESRVEGRGKFYRLSH